MRIEVVDIAEIIGDENLDDVDRERNKIFCSAKGPEYAIGGGYVYEVRAIALNFKYNMHVKAAADNVDLELCKHPQSERCIFLDFYFMDGETATIGEFVVPSENIKPDENGERRVRVAIYRMGLAMLAGGYKISGVLHGRDGKDRQFKIYGVRTAIESVSQGDIDSIEKNGPKNE